MKSTRIESNQTARRFDWCPLCTSNRIRLGKEKIAVSSPHSEKIELVVERWACPKCGEKFLTDASRRRMDLKLGLKPKS